MKGYGYDGDSDTGYGDFYGEETGNEGKYREGYQEKHPMLDNVISLLKALIGILDIISDNFDDRK